MSRVRLLAAGMLVAVVAVIATAVPASAHDQLISSSPQAGARLESAPTSIALEFSDELLTLGDAGTTVIVMDGDGRDWAAGKPAVEENLVTLDLSSGMPESGYEIRWQVVSSDGHPIAGVIPFTVGDAEPLAAAVASGGDDAGGSQAQEQSQDQATREHQGVLRAVLIGAGGAAVAAALFALIQFLRRRGARHDDTGQTAP
ncbi:copper resistance CopC family protein [Microbacterium marinilacus]|uniref:CopC domain-containing protein n=2 Tax=Microbacterium marinilacus TaxID=415209 RepID=A0ABP7BTT7_9MICO|nr:copper resistance protein CopC [Microbacterium marinilacus]